ncbi:hypothetical protein K438DRAFT_824343 [Mycena galopus ATCC 62051]|nr:hypothetical protein K438DRAFT_824343 [Mycena galopus ATCC 62051]
MNGGCSRQACKPSNSNTPPRANCSRGSGRFAGTIPTSNFLLRNMHPSVSESDPAVSVRRMMSSSLAASPGMTISASRASARTATLISDVFYPRY